MSKSSFRDLCFPPNEPLFGKLTPRAFFSPKGVFGLRNVVFMAMMLAIATILSLPGLTIYISPTFKAISFSYFPGVLVAAVCGPWAGIVYGVAADTLGYIVNPAGGYFPGYALSEAVTYFIFACFLYKRNFSLPRVFFAHLLKLIIVIFGLNAIWMSYFGVAVAAFFTGIRLINNIVQFPFHVALILVVGSQVLRLFRRYYLKKA
ncbi:MAG: folate family ECF transporter S component [Oscillospiraceae bacterium]|jgi:ECF transporter S component (folate family)|nr:folate family ECF transporter S component [Oscillospiraceae bacterium]